LSSSTLKRKQASKPKNQKSGKRTKKLSNNNLKGVGTEESVATPQLHNPGEDGNNNTKRTTRSSKNPPNKGQQQRQTRSSSNIDQQKINSKEISKVASKRIPKISKNSEPIEKLKNPSSHKDEATTLNQSLQNIPESTITNSVSKGVTRSKNVSIVSDENDASPSPCTSMDSKMDMSKQLTQNSVPSENLANTSKLSTWLHSKGTPGQRKTTTVKRTKSSVKSD
jgi:hypothetical protein